MAFELMKFDQAQEEAQRKSLADSIRAKGGTTAQMAWPDGFKAAVEAIGTNLFPPDEIPDYVKAEALAVAEKVKAFQTRNSITFLSVSDSHYMDGQNLAETVRVNTANLHMAQAAKIIAYSVHLDFCAHMGDFAFALGTTPREIAIRQIEELNGLLTESYPYFPQLRTVGNHDTGEYRVRQTGDLADLTGIPELKRLICDYNQGAVYGNNDYGYCYRDFPEKKFRVIVVNTCEEETTKGEGTSSSPVMSQAQLKWLARIMIETGDKAGWSWIIMGHYPADFGWTVQMGHIIHAYIDGTAVTVGGIEFNYAGHNAAKFVAEFHGHLHNYRVAKIQDTANGNPNLDKVEVDAKEICIPNSLPIANNTRTKPFWGIVYAEDVTYDKKQGTGEDTAFCVNVIDPDKQVIHSVHYGAGYDRTIGYAATVYRNIKTVLTNATLTNTATSVEDGQPFATAIVLADKYQLDSVTVIMGGADITAQVVSGKNINIPAVTAEVTITVVASKPVSYTNLVPTSINTDGSIYNGVGYKDGTWFHNGAEEHLGGFTLTGYIPVTKSLPFIIRVGGTASKTAAQYGVMVTLFNSAFEAIGYPIPGSRIGSTQYFGKILDESYPNQSLAWQVDNLTQQFKNAKYYRISWNTGDKGAGLIVTENQPIDD